jgi:hypothetical protein
MRPGSDRDLGDVPENRAPLRVTLDTNLLHEYWKEREKKVHVETLLRLAKEGRVELAVTARVREDIPDEPMASQIDQLPELGIAETGSVTRLDYWVLGRDQLGSDEFAAYEAEVRASGAREPNWKDLDHLHAHMLQRRDVFVTWEGSILRRGETLAGRFGIVVMKPEDLIESLTST